MASDTFGGLPSILKAYKAMKEYGADPVVRRYHLNNYVWVHRDRCVRECAGVIIDKLSGIGGLAFDSESLVALEEIPKLFTNSEGNILYLEFKEQLKKFTPKEISYQRMVADYLAGYGEKKDASIRLMHAFRVLLVLRQLVTADLFPEVEEYENSAA